jgi:hypothetical protein
MAKDARTIRQEIAQTRAQLGDTVEALAYQTDIAARVRDNVSGRVEAMKGTIGNVMDSVKTAVVGASDTVADSVKTAVVSAGDSVAQLGDTVEALTSQTDIAALVKNNVSNAVDSGSRTVAQAGDRLQNVDVAGNARRAVGAAAENPIRFTLAALAMGFLTGSLLPVSQAEREGISSIRKRILDRAIVVTGDLLAARVGALAEGPKHQT